MPSSAGSVALVGAVALAALVAALRTQHPPPTPLASTPIQRERSFEPSLDPSNEEAEEGALPPNHPPIGPSDPSPGALGSDHPEGAQKQAIVWKVPSRWTSVANPNAMRLATYRIKASAGGPDEGELSVVRAGGSTEANIERWVGQFSDAGPEKRAQRTVHGLKVTTVDVSGTFQAGGMAPDAPVVPRKGWMLRGAVVETDEGLYFFKMTGPSALVKSARGEFDALVSSISPVRGTEL